MKNFLRWESQITEYFNRWGGTRWDTQLRFISSVRFLAFFWTVLVFAAVISWEGDVRQMIERFLLVTILHFTITEGFFKHLLTKFFSKRERPYLLNPRIRPVGRKFSDASFPSSHMATTVAMLSILLFYFPSFMLGGILFTLLVAYSRLHNGMHYPSDVVAGASLGLFYGWVAIYLI